MPFTGEMPLKAQVRSCYDVPMMASVLHEIAYFSFLVQKKEGGMKKVEGH